MCSPASPSPPACIGGGSNAKLRSDCAADEVRSHENRVQTASEPFRNRGGITDLTTSEQLFHDIGLPPLDIETDRIMLCGSPGMLEDLRQTFEQRGFAEGSMPSSAISSSRRLSSSARPQRLSSGAALCRPTVRIGNGDEHCASSPSTEKTPRRQLAERVSVNLH